MNTDNTQDGAEPSLASAGSVANSVASQLAAWRDERGYPTPGEMMDEATQEIERLRKKESLLLAAGDLLEHQLVKVAQERDALRTCEAWLQKQVAERDAELVELRKTAAALMEIAVSGSDATTRRRMLDAMAAESFAENG
jgi:hypothetical protein